MRLMTTLALAAMLATPTLAQNRIDGLRPDAPEFAAPGDYRVGVTTLVLTNPGQIDIVNATETEAPLYDRALTVEVWYPASPDTVPGGTYAVQLRDGVTEVALQGQAARDAAPLQGARFPLVILSHGYPGNRFLMGHLGENLASKGYVVASIDHADSTYGDMAAFGSTLVNRPWDQRFVLDQLATLPGDLGAIIDADSTAVIGYSMGGYGALIFAGGGVTEAAPSFSYSAPQRLLERNMAGSDSLAQLVDPRVKAVVAFAPWGRNTDFWDATGLAGIEKPLMLIAGSADDVSIYGALRQIFAETTGTTRHLLTFQNANHNAGAPIPAPLESYAFNTDLGFAPFDHYADPVWDTVRMNNISQHFISVFLDLHLKGDGAMSQFLTLTPDSADGVWAMDDNLQPLEGHSYWRGFQNRTAAGLMFESLGAGQ